MKNSTLYILLAVIVVIGGAVLYHGKSAGPRASITLGAPIILSGDFTPIGERTKDAMNLAARDFEKAHPGTTVSIKFEDTHANPKDAVSAYRRLVDLEHVDAIVGPLLEIEMGSLQPMLEKDGVPLIAPSVTPPNVRGLSPNPVMMWPDPSHEAAQIAEYIYKQGIRRVAVLGTQDTWENEVSDAFVEKFTALGGTVVSKEITLSDSKDDRTTVTKALAKKPEALFFGTYFKFYDWIKTSRELGFTGKVYSIEIDTSMAAQAKDYANGLQFISPNVFTNAYATHFKESYGQEPSIPDGQAYDATTLALTLLYDNHLDKRAVIEAMGKLTSYTGVSGTITFDEKHRATFPLSIFEVNDGVITKVN